MEVDKVYSGDCIDIMRTLPDKSIDLVFADPPFNIGINLTFKETQISL